MTIYMIYVDKDEHPSFPDWESARLHFGEHSANISHAFEHTEFGVKVHTFEELDAMYQDDADKAEATELLEPEDEV